MSVINKYPEKLTVTLVFVMKGNSVLMGEILGGTIKGFLTPPGGKLEKKDRTIESSAKRELKEETGLTAIKLEKIAKVTIKIAGLGRRLIIHAFICDKWSGKLKIDRREFTYLKFFPINSIPWDKMAPGDKIWMEKALNRTKTISKIFCGSKRTEILKTSVEVI